MQLYVPIASLATLRLLWLVQIGKGVFSLQWPARIARDQRVELVLEVEGESLHMGARVRTCTPARVGYHVDLLLDELPEPVRVWMEQRVVGAAASRREAAAAGH
jgi:hypothetical protein